MAKYPQSLRGIISYSLCLCLALGFLGYSSYCLFFSDDDVNQSSVNTTLSQEDAGVIDEGLSQNIHSSTNTNQEDKEDTISDDTKDEQSSVIASMQLRDADITPSEDDDFVVYAADEIIEHHSPVIPDTEESSDNKNTGERTPICAEGTSSESTILGDAGENIDMGEGSQESCIPAHGENSFEVTPEYIDELDPSIPREPIYIRDKVRSGDSAGKILNTWLSPAEIHSLIASTNKVYKLSSIRVGQPYTVTLDPYDKSFQEFIYEIDNSKILTIYLDKTGAKSTDTSEEKRFIAEVTGIPYDYKLDLVQGTVENSLYGAVTSAGETTALGAQLTDIFGWEVDFVNDIRRGDTFTALVEKRYRNGVFKGYGRVLAATYTNDGELYEAFRFTDEYGGSAYFERDGSSLRKAYLKAPLNFTRISSPYTMKRYHPILKKNRPHQGIDYAAPIGTPVKTVGDGTVAFRGWMNGYGNIVRIRHANNIETMYAHLSRFAKNLKKGQRVRQGQVIAYVGTSGLSTGPHLDFRVRKNGQFVNPNTLLNPRSNPVPKKLKSEFAKRIKLYEQLQRDVDTVLYVPELVVDR